MTPPPSHGRADTINELMTLIQEVGGGLAGVVIVVLAISDLAAKHGITLS